MRTVMVGKKGRHISQEKQAPVRGCHLLSGQQECATAFIGYMKHGGGGVQVGT